MKSLLMTTLRSLLDDIQRLQPDVKGLDRDLQTIEARVKDEDNGFLTVALPSFGKALDRAYSSGWFTCPAGFKKIPRGSLPRLFSGLTSNVFDIKTGQLKEQPDIGSIVSLRQVTMLFKKLTLTSNREETLDFEAKAGFTSATNLFDPSREEAEWICTDMLHIGSSRILINAMNLGVNMVQVQLQRDFLQTRSGLKLSVVYLFTTTGSLILATTWPDSGLPIVCIWSSLCNLLLVAERGLCLSQSLRLRGEQLLLNLV